MTNRIRHMLERIDAVINFLGTLTPKEGYPGGALLIDTTTLDDLDDDSLFLHEFFERASNQSRVTAWVRSVFSEKEATNVPERALRTAEEALELAQACGVDAATLHRLVDYVMGRPAGEPAQEIAGTMVTLYAMATALGVNADGVFENELERIRQPEVIERCRRRQHEKHEALVGEALDEVLKSTRSTRVVYGYPSGNGSAYFASGWTYDAMFKEIARQKELYGPEWVWCEVDE